MAELFSLLHDIKFFKVHKNVPSRKDGKTFKLTEADNPPTETQKKTMKRILLLLAGRLLLEL
jgi:hypothetical protein